MPRLEESPPRARVAAPAPPAPPPSRERTRRWRVQWPLPVSLVLAVVYWLYLNAQVSRTVFPELKVEVVSPSGVIASRALNIRTPSAAYMVTELRDASDKVFDPEKRLVKFTIRAPGGQLRKIDTTLPLIVDIKEPEESGAFEQGELRSKFTRLDVLDANGELTPFIQAMEPAEITVYLRRKESMDLELRPEHVQLKFPEEGGWGTRVFRDSLEFDPSYVTLSGPKAELDGIDERSEVFVMDLTKKLARPTSTPPDQRQIVAVELRLRELWANKGISIAQQLRATVQVAPEPALFKDLTVPVVAMWQDSELAPSDFKVDQAVKVEIRSYHRELTRKLSSREDAEKWVRENVFCLVRVAEIDPTLDPHKSGFRTNLEPWWQVFDRNYRLDRDLKIQHTELINIERKAP